MPLPRETRLLLILASILVSSAIVAEVVAVKLFQVPFYGFLGWSKMFTLTCGSLVWPLVFLTTDTINEFYGRRAVRFVTWLTMAMITWTFIITTVSIQIPAVSFSPVGDDAFGQVFGQSAWIIVGSMAAFLVSQLVDVTVFHAVRRALGGRHIWARATGSTLVSQLIDSFVVIWIAFWLPGKVDAATALDISISGFTYKVGLAIALTPMIYLTHAAVHRWLGHHRATELADLAASNS